MFVSGMGFFTDAYGLFVIGIVVSLLKPQWVMSTNQVSWLNSATLLASAAGAIVFGRAADMLGRKRIYGYEVLILAAGAIASAFSPNYTFLLVCRIILGVGIGGDYPVSATIMSEYSGKQSRGRMVGLAVFYLRRQIHETPRFAMAGGAADEARAAIAAATDGTVSAGTARQSKARHSQGVADGFFKLIRNRRLAIWLLGTAGGWMLLDFCYYGNTISSPEILKLINPHASLLENTLIQLGIFAVFALPGYIVAILLLDKTGRRSIQVHRPRHIRRRRPAGRVRRRVPVPRLPLRHAGPEPRDAHRRGRVRRRHAADDRDAARAQGPEPGRDRERSLRAVTCEAPGAARDLTLVRIR
jgi:PHS family inorganic phosphate transporter-like MFS transporter